MASADFIINSTPFAAGTRLVDVAASSTVNLELVDNSGVSSVEWSCIGTHSSAVSTASITALINNTGSPPGATANFVIPAGDGQSYLFKCLVRDGEGVAEPAAFAIIGVLSSGGVVPFVFGEEFQRSTTHGWIDLLNSVLGSATLDHGTLSGLLDDDHTQYLLVDGSRAITGPLTATGANDLQLNAPTGQEVDLNVNGVTEVSISATTVDAQDNDITTTGDLTSGSVTAAGGSDVVINAPTGQQIDFQVNGTSALGLTASGFSGKFGHTQGAELTIAAGAITVTDSYHTVDTEADAATDDIETINGGVFAGQRIVIRPQTSARTIVVKHNIGNIDIGADFTMQSSRDTMELIWSGSDWLGLSRSDNGT